MRVPVNPSYEHHAHAANQPDVIRLAPCPLYNTFAEVHRVVELLASMYRYSRVLLLQCSH